MNLYFLFLLSILTTPQASVLSRVADFSLDTSFILYPRGLVYHISVFERRSLICLCRLSSHIIMSKKKKKLSLTMSMSRFASRRKWFKNPKKWSHKGRTSCLNRNTYCFKDYLVAKHFTPLA